MSSSMVSRARCLVHYMTWWAYSVVCARCQRRFYWVGRIGREYSWGVATAFCSSGPLIALQLPVVIGSLGSFVFGLLVLTSSIQFSSYLCAEKRCEVVVWGSLV